MPFAELGLDPKLLSAVTAAGYHDPTPIQAQAIPAVLGGRDVTGIAQTGTGKTAAFVLPMIHKLGQGRAKARMPRSLILEPTRELAAQVSENFEKYGVNYKLSMALLIGGVSFGDQDRKLTAGVDVLIATPGRLIDQFERGKLLLSGVQMLVIDEADRMLDMGFIPDIERICGLLPRTRQTLLFSATMPPEITRLAQQFQSDPMRIEVAKPATAATTITQYMTPCPSNEDTVKRAVLRTIITAASTQNGIVFCNRKREVDTVAKSLQKHGFDAAAIHGDLPQSLRTQTLDRFRNGELRLLVASDVAARGLDIPEVSQVFNYAPPPNADDYVHRIGRTGRAGRSGESYTIVSPGDQRLWDAVTKRIAKDVELFRPEGFDEAVAAAKGRGPAPRRSSADDRRPRKASNHQEDERGSDDSVAEGGRSGRRRRPRRGERSPPPVAAETDDARPTQPPEPEATPATDGPRRRRGGRGRHRGSEQPAAAAATSESFRPEDAFRGMGDHVPAFLLRKIGADEQA
ncbi:DEAD/DEAH box helicase [bacterium]|nr:DEAD/DEAH box helicase [bacterium]